MCLAPRYKKGTTAGPSIDCTNSASRRDTPCASSTPDSANAAATTRPAAAPRLTVPSITPFPLLLGRALRSALCVGRRRDRRNDPDVHGEQVELVVAIGVNDHTLSDFELRRRYLLLVDVHLGLLVHREGQGLSR